MALSPVVVFAYNRPWHIRQTIDSLRENILASESEVFIYSDAASTEAELAKVAEVRAYIKTLGHGFKKITVIERDINFGLADSIIEGVTTILGMYDKIIVLEDDMVTSPYFLTYMNEGLDRFSSSDDVISIHGYLYPVREVLPETFFLLGADCWGWATWQRGWSLFNPDGKALFDELERRALTNLFDFNNSYPYTKMLRRQIVGENHSWAIRWYASAFLAGKLTLYPGRSLVNNIGNDSSGRHCGSSSKLDVRLSDVSINLSDVEIVQSVEARLAFERFFRRNKTLNLYDMMCRALSIFQGRLV
ncbi:glycosyltransferase family A protein [Methylomonas koyamae]|uniref:glycosyltransferase family A protein n=1 Tax=Methylomonas koyamae TaxID=702114 RepID=UPI00287361BE|nr:glycosyltransferase family A protein [Methylomonas koyamae]WNB74217.1 glycosyltransferase family A protein [Methylomonas koyamae]